MATPTAIAAYLALFAGIAGLFLFVNLLVGRLVRPNLPNEEKLEVYECGEPVIGSSFVQFDLRFYVVALLFIIFDVEVAFFFPWATVYGKSTQLASPNMPVVATDLDETAATGLLSIPAVKRLQELGVTNPQASQFVDGLGVEVTGAEADTAVRNAVQDSTRKIALLSMADIGVFFAVLLVGFAYVWRRGDLDWVHATTGQGGEVVEHRPPSDTEPIPRAAGSILST